MDQVKRQLFIDEAYLKTSAWKGVLKTSTKTKISTYNYPSTTTLLSGGLVHEISRSFHYWQLAPKWRLLPWLANPGNPAMSPHTGKGNRHPTHWYSSVNREGRGEENCPDDELPLQTTLKVHTHSKRKNASNKEQLEFQHLRMCKKKRLIARECWMDALCC